MPRDGGRSAATVMVEAKGPDGGRVRLVVASVVAVGACHAPGSDGANLGTDVVTAAALGATPQAQCSFDGARGSMFLELGDMVAFEVRGRGGGLREGRGARGRCY